MLSKIPMGRTGTIEEVAAFVHFLVSSEASYTTDSVTILAAVERPTDLT